MPGRRALLPPGTTPRLGDNIWDLPTAGNCKPRPGEPGRNKAVASHRTPYQRRRAQRLQAIHKTDVYFQLFRWIIRNPLTAGKRKAHGRLL